MNDESSTAGSVSLVRQLGSQVLAGGVPLGISALSIGMAVVGALLLGGDGGIDGVNGFVEGLSGRSSSALGDLGLLAPLGFAFAVGMASAVNPCGFAMLPAYLGLYLGKGKDEGDISPVKQLSQAIVVGGAVTCGFLVLFGGVGLAVALGARTIVADILPWLGLGIGMALVFAGSWMVSGGKIYTGLAARIADRMGDPGRISVRGYFIFGLSYGTASLSCTLPLFLSLVGSSLAVSSIVTSIWQFVLYALGMGVVITTLTLGIAFFKGAVTKFLRKALPYIEPLGAWLMVLAGSYIVFYWLTIGSLL